VTPLSPRELEVARLVADGLGDKEVARILLISTRTVQDYLDRISRKIGACDDLRLKRRNVIARWIDTNDREVA
jgi:DNA-binding NarL/FixJ family response regulator